VAALKPESVAGHQLALGVFPRLTSRGCVEAVRSATDRESRACAFHDSRVVAALKPVCMRRATRCELIRFPRLTSRGCVEASSLSTIERSLPRFPRLTSRGCVEADADSAVPLVPSFFPRLTSRGCVEAALAWSPCSDDSPFPRLTSRGCVEARQALRAWKSYARSSFHDSRVVAALKHCCGSVAPDRYHCFPRLTSRGCVEAPRS